MGRKDDPPAVIRHMLSLTFATGSSRNWLAKSGLTFCFLFNILKPIDTDFPPFFSTNKLFLLRTTLL